MPSNKTSEEKINLSDRNVLEATKKQAADILGYNKAKEARDLTKRIEASFRENPGLKGENKPLWQEWRDLSVKLEWIAFPFLNFRRTVEIFGKNLVDAFNLESYFLEKELKIRLITIPLLEERDKYKKKIREAMLKNNQKITSADISIGGTKNEPTVANWLRLYNQILGTGKVSKLKQAEFLAKNTNIIKLSSEEKGKIKRLFNLYEKLKISSLGPEGIEEGVALARDNKLEIIEEGKVSDVIRLREPAAPIKEARPTESFGQAKKEIQLLPEEEIKAIEKEAEELGKEASKEPIKMGQAVKNVITEAKLIFPNEILAKRFENIATSFLKDIRKEIDIRAVLKRPQKIGGMEFDEGTMDKIVRALNKEKSKIKIEPLKVVESSKPDLAEGLASPAEIIPAATRIAKPIHEEVKPTPPEEPAPSKEPTPPEEPTSLPEPKEVAEPSSIPPSESPATPVLPEVPKEVKEPPSPEVRPSEEITKVIEEEKPKPPPLPPTEETGPISIHRPPPKPNIAKVEEIKVKPRIYGPVDELRTLKIEDWRRWGTPKEASQKIKDKIDLLAEESLVKKAQGIKAWKESEINQLYLDIGSESIDEGISIEEMIALRQKEGSPTLTEEEFNVIIELNQKLRF